MPLIDEVSPAMIKLLRKVGAFLMFSILIGGFAIGIGANNYFDRQSRETIAKVGSIEITPQQFQRAYQRMVENISARAGRRLTPQEAQALGMPSRVLENLIQDAAVDLDAKRLGLGLSQEGLRESIYNTEYFQGANGKFDLAKYQQFLQQVGYSAPAFEQEMKQDLIRRQIRVVFEGGAVVPRVLLDAYNKYTNEQRVLSYFTLQPSAAGEIEAPTDEKLHAYYDDHKALFMAPEYRKVAVLAISPQTVASKITVTDEDLKSEYDAKAANYSVPERRKIVLIPFPTPKAAAEGATSIKGGKDFVEVAKDAGFQSGDLDIGTVSKKEFAAKFATNDAIINAAFALGKGQVSEPIEGPLSTVVMRVDDIVPGQDKSFDEAKDRIRDDLAKLRTAAETSKLIKAFEDDRATGASLADGAKKLGLPLSEVALDRGGKGMDGNSISLGSVPGPALATAAFKSDVGVENDALRLQGGGYAWFEVQDIVKPRQKPFDEVKADVEAAWRKDETRAKVSAKGQDLTSRIEHGETMADVAKSVGAEVKTSQPLKREGTEQGLPQAAIAQAFSLGEGGTGSVLAADGVARTIFHVDKVTPPPPLDDAGAKAVEQKLGPQIASDNLAQYLAGVTRSAGVSIDNKNLAAIAGGSVDTEE